MRVDLTFNRIGVRLVWLKESYFDAFYRFDHEHARVPKCLLDATGFDFAFPQQAINGVEICNFDPEIRSQLRLA